MTDSGQPDRTSTTIPGRFHGDVYIPSVTVTADNIARASVPSSLAAAADEPGGRASWDVSSLDEAITWLTALADHLKRLYHGMDDIKALMDGPKYNSDVMQHSGTGGQSFSPLGGFPWAEKLAERHNTLFQSYNGDLKTVVDNLYDAADALKLIKSSYQDAERASVMSASDLESDFTVASSGQHHDI